MGITVNFTKASKIVLWSLAINDESGHGEDCVGSELGTETIRHMSLK